MRLKTVLQISYKLFLKTNIPRKHFDYSKEHYENKYFNLSNVVHFDTNLQIYTLLCDFRIPSFGFMLSFYIFNSQQSDQIFAFRNLKSCFKM